MRTEDALATVKRNVEDGAQKSIRHHAQQLELYPSTSWNIVQNHFHSRTYKIQRIQELKPRDHYARLTFSKLVKNSIHLDSLFQLKILTLSSVK